MIGTATPRRWRGPARAAVLAVAWLCVLSLASGSLELHRDAAAHLAVATPGGPPAGAFGAGDETVFVCPDEHGAASHVERARPVERHDCAACLHRLQSRGGELRAAAAAVADAASGLAGAERCAAPSAPVLSRAPSRGPPAA